MSIEEGGTIFNELDAEETKQKLNASGGADITTKLPLHRLK